MTKTRADKRRARRRAAHNHRDDHAAPGFFTHRDREFLLAAMRAEQDGDLESALECLRRTPHRHGSGWERQVADLVTLGDRAEPWQWARFAVAAAQRWIAGLPTPLAAKIEREVHAGVAPVGPVNGPDLPGRLLAEQMTLSRTVADILLFEDLMLELFLVRVAPRLDGRGGGGRGWAESPGRVYELGDVSGIELRVRDRRTGEWHVVRHLGETVGPPRGAFVYGRLLRVPGTPGLVFSGPPFVIDGPAAQRLERLCAEDEIDLIEWSGVLGDAVRSGTKYLQPPPDYDEPPAAGVRLLMDQGLDREAAERFAMVQSLVAMHAIDPGSAPVYAHHAAEALADPAVEAEVRRRLTGSSYAAMWRSLAAAGNGLDRERFLSLAETGSASEPASGSAAETAAG